VGRIVATRYTSVEPGVDLHLYQGLLKGTKLEMVLQKGTELGVSAFIPTVTARSVATGASDSRRRRHDAIVREAAEQSGRGRVPRVADPLRFEEAIRHAAGSGQVVLLWEGEASARLCEIPLPERGATIGLFVGPEGGFTKEEAATAGAHGAHVVTLGRRILRAETAGIVGPALVLARLGELG
jgi:16S rRNA (uracil1498-N3)-methyltransferase